MKRLLRYTLVTLLASAGLAVGQRPTPQPADRPTGYILPNTLQAGYFQFPIQPGRVNSLSGGLGDLRPNHFHAGLDIRTGGREGLPVHAAADGYVSRIAVFTGGYGNVVFLKHPNGLTTVYGHLKTLNDTLGRYLRTQQYARQTFEIDLRPAPGQFPVRQGDVIAASGNTGGSGGPHLHFEVRDARDNLINPLLYGFPELSDDVPPYFERIALKTMTADSRINGEYQRVSYVPVRKLDGTYTLSQPVSASGLIGLEVLGYDKANGSPYRNGISCLEIKLDGREVFAYNMNSFPNEQTRFMNIHENYEVEQTSGQRYHRGYIADGNLLNLYKVPSNAAYRGRLPLLDGKPHEVTLTLFDAYDHPARLTFTLLPDGVPVPPPPADTLGVDTDSADTDEAPRPVVSPPSPVGPPSATITTDENVLKLSVRNVSATNPPVARLMSGRTATDLPASYVRNDRAVYLIDLRQYLPDSVLFGRSVVRTYFKKRILPGRAETLVVGSARLSFGPKTLFDTLHLAVRPLAGSGLEINQSTIPLNELLTIDYQPTGPMPADTARTKMYWTSGGRASFLGGTWRSGRIEFKTRSLGRFQLMTDSNAPTVQILSATPAGITARIRDDLSGIADFRALVNGEWVLMQYDYKRALLWSDPLEPGTPFEPGDEVLVQVKDRSGNIGSDSTVVAAPRPPVRRAPARPSSRKRKR
ncbi:hypothetical protein GCM10027578_36300 [Spirosoma luteolum]